MKRYNVTLECNGQLTMYYPTYRPRSLVNDFVALPQGICAGSVFANLKKVASSGKKGKPSEKMSLSDWPVGNCVGALAQLWGISVTYQRLLFWESL